MLENNDYSELANTPNRLKLSFLRKFFQSDTSRPISDEEASEKLVLLLGSLWKKNINQHNDLNKGGL